MARQKTYSRDDVILKALGAFHETGYFATSISTLVEVTLLNRKIIYEQFSSKEGLFLEALRLYMGRMEAAWERYLAPEPLGISNIRSYFRYLAHEFPQKGDLASLTVNEASRSPEEAVELCREHLMKLEAIFTTNLIAEYGRTPSVYMSAKALVFQQSALSTMGRLGTSVEDLQRMANYVLGAIFAQCEDTQSMSGMKPAANSA